ncbi:MAG: DUF87 domain-containing protein, partial [Candidatus Dormibacteraeota bacterium]|nr:DUF87 domain-containing protein [Candidatus Dormibacteraeota bacterium]
MRPIQVPMALRAELKLPIGPFEVPFRTALMLIGSLPLVLVVFTLPLSLTTQALIATGILGTASVVSRPDREGVWVGTWALSRALEPLFPQLLRDGRPRSAAVHRVGHHLRLPVSDRSPLSLPRALAHWSDLPRVRDVDEGLMRLGPDGGWHAVLRLDGPRDAPITKGYEAWCQGVVDWINTVGAPAQLYTEVTHYERLDAQHAFERSLRRERTNLIDYERQLAGQVAERSLAVRQFVVLSPHRTGPNGIPTANRLTSVLSTVAASRAEAVRLRDLAVRQGDALGVGVRVASARETRMLLARTPLGCEDAIFHGGEVVVDGRHSRVGTVVELPTRLLPGAVMSAVIRARIRGSVSFHLLPVQPSDARRELKRQESLYRAMFQRSKSADVGLLYHHARKLDEMLLSRQTTAMRVALTCTVDGETSEAAELAFERLHAALLDEEMTLQRLTTPTALVAASGSPGGRPLNRSLFLTTGDVAAYLLAGQGSAFGDPTRPLVGIDAATTATCWYSVFDRTNFSALILGSSGAGKSVAAKTLLMRHYEQGADILIVDPESEYQPVVAALGGRYVELGDQSLNAFAVPPDVPPEVAAGTVTRVLSVMVGE